MSLVRHGFAALVGLFLLWCGGQWQRQQAYGRRAEARFELRRLQAAMDAYYATNGFYPTLEVEPALVGPLEAGDRRPWTARPCASECGRSSPASCRSFSCVAYAPTGAVRYWYACTSEERAGVWNYTCAAVGDVGGDAGPSVYVYGTGHGSAGTIVAPVPSIAADSGCAPGRTPAGEVTDCAWSQR